jgi:AcrR family transcriptional regulator
METRERLLDTAGVLLGEVGIERISTNMIAARAGVTPPALYRYFRNKYEVLEALGLRLMERQNAVLDRWLDEHGPQGVDALRGALEALLRGTVDVTASEPGAIWTLRALRAVPQLVHIRLESHRYVTDRLTEVIAKLSPDLPRDEVWRRVRLAVELGFAADEMLTEEDAVPAETVFRETARALAHIFE